MIRILIPFHQAITLVLDGFGNGTVKEGYNDVEAGTYTIEHSESWYTLSGTNIYEVAEYYIVFTRTSDSKEYLFTFKENLAGKTTAAVVRGEYGIYEFSNALVNTSSGAYYNDGNTKAFLYIHDTIGNSEDRVADIWIGTFNEENSIWLYTKYDEGGITYNSVTQEYSFVGIGLIEEFEFYFTIDSEGKEVAFAGSDLVIFEDESGKLVMDTFGKPKFTPAGSETAQDAELTFEDGLVYIYTFKLTGGNRSFYFENDNGVRKAVEITADNIFDINYLFEDRRNAYSARIIRINDSEALLGLLLEDGGYFYCYLGTFTAVEGTDDEYEFNMTYSAFAENEYTDVAAVYGSFRLKVAEANGKNVFYQYDRSFSLSGKDGSLAIDGYGAAEYTTASGTKLTGHYQIVGNIVTFTETVSSTEYIFKLTADDGFEAVSNIGNEVGYYYTLDEFNNISNYYLFLDGNGTVLIFNGNVTVWGSYERLQNNRYEEYKLEVDGGLEGNLTYRIIVARVEGINIYVMRDDTQAGSFMVKGGGFISGDGYMDATYTTSMSGGTVYAGVMQIGTLTDDKFDSSRNFAGDAAGKHILFVAGDDDGNVVAQFIFDIEDGRAVLRDNVYGAFGLRENGVNTGEYIYLDGHGNATIYGADKQEVEKGEYSALLEVSSSAYAYKSDTTSFTFSTFTLGTNYLYSVYDGENDGVYTGENMSALVLDGFVSGKYIDRYGVVIGGEYSVVDDGLICLNPDNANLADMYFDVEGSAARLIEGDFIVKGDTLYLYIGVIDNAHRELKIPDGVKRIEEGAFDRVDKDYLEELDLNEVEFVGNNVFMGLSLNTLVAPKLKEIGDFAFKNNQDLTSLDLPEAVTIGEEAFSGCYQISSVNIPKAKTVGEAAFYNCRGIRKVTFGAIESIGAEAFKSSSYNTIELDFSAVTDFNKVRINETAFVNMYDEPLDLLISVADIDAFNAIYASNWSDALKSAAKIADAADDEFGGKDFYSFKTGNLLSFADGGVKWRTLTGESYEETDYGRYFIASDGSAKIYKLNGTEWAVTETIANTAVITVNGDKMYKDGTEHSFAVTDSETLLKVVIDSSFSYGMCSVSVSSLAYGESVATEKSFDNGVFSFTLSDGTYTAEFVSTTEKFTVVKTGSILVLETDGTPKYRVTFDVGEDGDINTIQKLEKTDLYGDYAAIEITKVQKDGNVFTVDTKGMSYIEIFAVTVVPAVDGGKASVSVSLAQKTIEDGYSTDYSWKVTYTYKVENGENKLIDCSKLIYDDVYPGVEYTINSSEIQADGSILLTVTDDKNAERKFNISLIVEYGNLKPVVEEVKAA